MDDGQDLTNIQRFGRAVGLREGRSRRGTVVLVHGRQHQSGVVGTFDAQPSPTSKLDWPPVSRLNCPCVAIIETRKRSSDRFSLWTGADIGITQVYGFGNRPRGPERLPCRPRSRR